MEAKKVEINLNRKAYVLLPYLPGIVFPTPARYADACPVLLHPRLQQRATDTILVDVLLNPTFVTLS